MSVSRASIYVDGFNLYYGALKGTPYMLRVFEYNANLWQTTIDKDLPKLRDFIRGAWENRTSDKSYMKILRGKTKDST